MLKIRLFAFSQKLIIRFIPKKTPKQTLPINYYDPKGNKIGTYHFNPHHVKSTNLKNIIDQHVPKNYIIVPYFAYPKDKIIANTPEEIMIVVILVL